VIEADPIRVDKLREIGVPVLYGEAGNSEIMEHAALSRARALVVTLPDDAAALAVVITARKIAPGIHIVARASTWDGARQLMADGAGEVVRPELEGGVEIVRRTLLELRLPVREIQRYTDLVRREGLDETDRLSLGRVRVLDDLVKASRDLELGWIVVGDQSPLAGVRIADASLRQIAGVSVVAISRERAIAYAIELRNPPPEPYEIAMFGVRSYGRVVPPANRNVVGLLERYSMIKIRRAACAAGAALLFGLRRSPAGDCLQGHQHVGFHDRPSGRPIPVFRLGLSTS